MKNSCAPFELPFQALRSDVDEWGERNVINKNLAKVARWVRKASSAYRVEGEAKVQGVALNPFAKTEVELN